MGTKERFILEQTLGTLELIIIGLNVLVVCIVGLLESLHLIIRDTSILVLIICLSFIGVIAFLSFINNILNIYHCDKVY